MQSPGCSWTRCRTLLQSFQHVPTKQLAEKLEIWDRWGNTYLGECCVLLMENGSELCVSQQWAALHSLCKVWDGMRVLQAPSTYLPSPGRGLQLLLPVPPTTWELESNTESWEGFGTSVTMGWVGTQLRENTELHQDAVCCTSSLKYGEYSPPPRICTAGLELGDLLHAAPVEWIPHIMGGAERARMHECNAAPPSTATRAVEYSTAPTPWDRATLRYEGGLENSSANQKWINK